MGGRRRVSAILGAMAATAIAVLSAQQPAPPEQPPPQPPVQQPPAERPPAGQQPPPPTATGPNAEQPRPVIRRGINFVSVDVIVTDKQGNPITDLTPEDFDVLEDNARQKIDTFQLIKIDQATATLNAPLSEVRTRDDEEREAARPDVRIFAIFLDDYHVRRGASMGVRSPLMKFIEQQIAPGDLVGLMYPLTPVSDFSLTRNHGSIVAAVQNFMGRKFDYEPRNQFEEQYAYYPAQTVEKIRNQVTMSALRALAIRLGGYREGRKSIIFVSEGFTAQLPPQLNDPVAALPGMGNPARTQPGTGYANPRAETEEFFASTEILGDMREVYDAANRSNTSIYALDPRGLATFEYDINEGVGLKIDSKALTSTQDTLRVLADQTDGRAIVNRNDLDGGLRQIVRDSSAYYLLGYNSTQAPSDGKFHAIKVRVKRPGAQVRARRGYWAMTAEDTARATAPPKPGPPPAVEAALNSLATASRRDLVRTWIGTAKGENGKTKVTVAWEPVPPPPGSPASREDGPARLSVTAIAPTGEPYFRGKVADPRVAVFDAAPGPMQVKYNIENERGQVLDAAQRELTVPDFSKTEVALSTPYLLRARTQKEIAALKADPTAPPTPDREFRRTERLAIRVEAYAANGAPTLTAKLLNRSGQPMTDLPIEAAAGPRHFDLPLSSLAPGEYLVEITATAGGSSSQELLAIRVIS